MSKIFLPQRYRPLLGPYETQTAIGLIKRTFEKELSDALLLQRVSAPLFVDPETGLNDDLNGVERPVRFDISDSGKDAVVVHSLAKWKRMALYQYGFPKGRGLYTDMNAIRRDETLDNLHSVYCDQWDWEKIIGEEERTTDYLKETVRKITAAICDTQKMLSETFPQIPNHLRREVSFLTTQELEDRYPALTPKEREQAYTKEHGTVFLMQVGGKLRSGEKHDGRAPDYDDWSLNGDLLFWSETLDCAVEISSMGIRVNAESMARQLELAGAGERQKYTFHQKVLDGTLPLTMGGGIGQSRLCLLLLGKAHIGEVQVSVWDDNTYDACRKAGIPLL